MTKQAHSPQELIQILTQRRKELSISQPELAQLANLSTNGISKLESQNGDREIKLSTLFKISPFLGIKLLVEFEE